MVSQVFFCCKCGKFVSRSKHIKLKITNNPCPQRHSEIILEQDGFNRSEKRLDDLYQDLCSRYNASAGHNLEWNRKIGKIINSNDEGLLKCLNCHRTWRWKDRRCLPQTKCTQPNRSASSAMPSSEVVLPRRRLNTKTPVSQIEPRTSSYQPSNGPAIMPQQQSSASSSSAAGDGAAAARAWRAGVG